MNLEGLRSRRRLMLASCVALILVSGQLLLVLLCLPLSVWTLLAALLAAIPAYFADEAWRIAERLRRSIEELERVERWEGGTAASTKSKA